MLALGAEIGPRRAHELIHAAAARGHEAGLTFHDALLSDPAIAAHLPTSSMQCCSPSARWAPPTSSCGGCWAR